MTTKLSVRRRGTILERVRNGEDGILAIGNHPAVIQSILDLDFLSGKRTPSILGIITGNRKAYKCFFGTREIMIPCFKDLEHVPPHARTRVRWMLNLQSGRRAFDSTMRFFEAFPQALGGHIFAENVPEAHAAELIRRFSGKLIAGPSGVGILVPGHLKLGAIGGIDASQLEAGKLKTPGTIAVVSTSGGMTNELIRAVAASGHRVSFSVCIGGDRFPVTPLSDVLALAQTDPQTEALVYFGELGGSDEYEIAELLEKKRFTKPVVAYVAGIIDEAFDEHMQFGHAKALVRSHDESARAKRDALVKAGAVSPATFPEFLQAIAWLPRAAVRDTVADINALMNRTPSILSTREVVDQSEIPVFVRAGKLARRSENAFAASALKALLGRDVSPITAAYAEGVFELLMDHGGAVSGAVNTMVTARAGKDMVSSLAAGLLTVGPRFGGAVNDAARAWLSGVASGKDASDFVETRARESSLIPGIGHRKYRVGVPDPRVAALAQFATLLKKHPHYDFARAVEVATTAKNGQLILNVDGTIAALFLDILAECEKYSRAELEELVDVEFFNALFIIPRSVGFIAHFIEQKLHDEGLFRLPEELLFVRPSGKKKKK